MSDQENKREYKGTFKNTMAFGGLQIITIIISIIRGKFLAVLLGPSGIGINNMFMNSLNMITTFNDLGLDLSSVKNIAESHENKDVEKLNRTITIVRKLFLWTAIFGAFLTIILSFFLSKWTFGTSNYTISFLFLSIYVLLITISKRQQTILRGLRKIDYILKSTLIGSILGLVLTIPLFYFFGTEAIVGTIILTSVITLFTSHYFYKKLNIENVKLQNKEIYSEGKQMISLGLVLVASTLFGMIVKYLISVGINKIGNVSDVGLYTAATSITGQYIGFILSSLSVDYFPKLAAVSNDNKKLNQVVNEQIEIVLLLATPILLVMLISSPFLIKFFLSKEFLLITDFIRYIALGSFFQVFSFCLGYISFAKNDRRTYLMLEGGFGASLHLVLTLVSYYFWGIQGFGIGFLSIYLIYTVVILIVTKKIYNFTIKREIITFFIVNFLFLLVSFILFKTINENISYSFNAILLVLNVIYNYKILSRKIDIKNLIFNKIKNLKNK